MACTNKPQPHPSGNTSEDKVNKILEILPDLNNRLSSLNGDPLGRRRDKEESVAEGNNGIKIARRRSAPPAMTHAAFDGQVITRIQYHFRLLKLQVGKLEQFQTNMGVELDRHLLSLQSLITNLDSSSLNPKEMYWIEPELEKIEKKISGLLYQAPSLPAKSENQKATVYGGQDGEEDTLQGKRYYYLPGIHSNAGDLIKCEAFRKVKHKFTELEIKRKICLLSFAVFPENREVHRTALMYWWIGEGIIPLEGAEEAVRDVLKEFTEKNLVEPVEDRCKLAPSSYKMTPFVHASVIHLAEKIGLFNIYDGKHNKPSTNKSEMGKVCLVETSTEAAAPTKKEDIRTVFNVSERYLDSTVKWFLKNPRACRRFTFSSSGGWFKLLNVFYLGRWERSNKRHIQVSNHELMKCLKHLEVVKVLSFQGISTIRRLRSSVCKLHQLVVLDLRDCHELTELPEKIDSLRNLVYLDMTGCYMLEWVPLRLALLKKLEVLKGFVVSDYLHESVACKLSYLKNLTKLRKLSIEINTGEFTVSGLMVELVELKALTSLKVTWRRDSYVELSFMIRRYPRKDICWPNGIEKLSLQRFPDEELPEWLHPSNMLNLKKLHIGGGKDFRGFGKLPEEETKCSVEVLRLRALPKLRVGWLELKELYFPKLTFLEKYECPRVTLTPCDGNGIWRSDQD